MDQVNIQYSNKQTVDKESLVGIRGSFSSRWLSQREVREADKVQAINIIHILCKLWNKYSFNCEQMYELVTIWGRRWEEWNEDIGSIVATTLCYSPAWSLSVSQSWGPHDKEYYYFHIISKYQTMLSSVDVEKYLLANLRDAPLSLLWDILGDNLQILQINDDE